MVIDALLWVKQTKRYRKYNVKDKKYMFVTMHREKTGENQ